MNEEQKEAFEQIEKQVNVMGFTPIAALTMILSYHKGGYYEKLNDKDFEVVVKHFVERYM
ncbi:hypothetical protein [Enterococcus sp. DIV0170]|uniref:hypothetical protein n=1 Tax=Enterococcus sp. DIV0170 TaxID=2774642 RepID=UPI003F2664A4